MTAAIDLAGYLLAFKATEGTDMDNPNTDPSFTKVHPGMQAVQLGTLPQDILYHSFHWAITTPEASEQLTHTGNINNIP